MTLIPVNKTSVEVESSSNFGACLWIGNPADPALGKSPNPSIASPITLKDDHRHRPLQALELVRQWH